MSERVVSENELIDTEALAAHPANTVACDAPAPSNHSTGPRTPEGKAISSGNARTHGCCSRQIIIKGESQDDYDRLCATWFKKYGPIPLIDPEVFNIEADEILLALIQNAADNQWLLFRAQRRFDEIEWQIDGFHAASWPPEYTQRFSLFQRDLRTAERAFYKAMQVLEKYCKDHVTLDQRTAEHKSRLELTAAKVENVKAHTAKTKGAGELQKILLAEVSGSHNYSGSSASPTANLRKKVADVLNDKYLKPGKPLF